MNLPATTANNATKRMANNFILLIFYWCETFAEAKFILDFFVTPIYCNNVDKTFQIKLFPLPVWVTIEPRDISICWYLFNNRLIHGDLDECLVTQSENLNRGSAISYQWNSGSLSISIDHLLVDRLIWSANLSTRVNAKCATFMNSRIERSITLSAIEPWHLPLKNVKYTAEFKVVIRQRQQNTFDSLRHWQQVAWLFSTWTHFMKSIYVQYFNFRSVFYLFEG